MNFMIYCREVLDVNQEMEIVLRCILFWMVTTFLNARF